MAGTLSTEAQAIIQEMPRGDPMNRNNQLASYAHQVAKSHLGVFPADDDTAITQAWMFSVGGTNANPSVFAIGAGINLSVNTSGATAITATTPASTTIASITTRGGLRRAAVTFGITLTGLG